MGEKGFKFNVVGQRGIPKLRKFKHIGLASGILLATLGVASNASADEVSSSATDTSSSFVLDQSGATVSDNAPASSVVSDTGVSEYITTGTPVVATPAESAPAVSTPTESTPTESAPAEVAKSDTSVVVSNTTTTGGGVLTPSVSDTGSASATVDEGMHATNLADAQGESSKDAKDIKEKAGTSEGILKSDVVDDNLNKSISTATSEGVSLTDKGKVTYKTLEWHRLQLGLGLGQQGEILH